MNRAKTIVNWIFIAIMILLIPFASFMVIASILGWQFNPVMSGSMDPVLKTGDVVATRPADAGDIEVGDIITYRSPQLGKVVVHRVIEKQEGDQVSFITKGDANENADPYPVPAENILNKVGFHIPYLGYMSRFVTSGSGITLLFVMPVLLILCKEIGGILKGLPKTRRSREPVAVPSLPARAQWATGLSTEDWVDGRATI